MCTFFPSYSKNCCVIFHVLLMAQMDNFSMLRSVISSAYSKRIEIDGTTNYYIKTVFIQYLIHIAYLYHDDFTHPHFGEAPKAASPEDSFSKYTKNPIMFFFFLEVSWKIVNINTFHLCIIHWLLSAGKIWHIYKYLRALALNGMHKHGLQTLLPLTCQPFIPKFSCHTKKKSHNLFLLFYVPEPLPKHSFKLISAQGHL